MVWINAISNNLSKSDSKNSPDVKFATGNGPVFMHKMVLFSGLPGLREMLCNACVDSHENLTIVVPDITKEMVQEAVDEFYDNGNGNSLAMLFSLGEKSNTKHTQKLFKLEEVTKKVILKKDDALETDDQIKDEPKESYRDEILTNIYDKVQNLKNKYSYLEENKVISSESDEDESDMATNIKLELDENEENNLLIDETTSGSSDMAEESLLEQSKEEVSEGEDYLNDEVYSNSAELWFKDTYPELYNTWKEACSKRQEPDSLITGRPCPVCELKIIEGINYGVGLCEAERHFIKRTFFRRLSYPPCSSEGSCPPRARGWCQFCRLKAIFSTPIRIGSIKNVDNDILGRKEEFESISPIKHIITEDPAFSNSQEINSIKASDDIKLEVLQGFGDVQNYSKQETDDQKENRNVRFEEFLKTQRSVLSIPTEAVSTTSSDALKDLSPDKTPQANLNFMNLKQDHESQSKKEYRAYMGAEFWLQDTHPDLYEVWKEALKTEKQDKSNETCSVCKLKSGHLHYGVRLCEAEKQFIKRTFHHRLSYDPCMKGGSCPPRARGWCQQCRLRACLSTPIEFSKLRCGQHFKINRKTAELCSPDKQGEKKQHNKDPMRATPQNNPMLFNPMTGYTPMMPISSYPVSVGHPTSVITAPGYSPMYSPFALSSLPPDIKLSPYFVPNSQAYPSPSPGEGHYTSFPWMYPINGNLDPFRNFPSLPTEPVPQSRLVSAPSRPLNLATPTQKLEPVEEDVNTSNSPADKIRDAKSVTHASSVPHTISVPYTSQVPDTSSVHHSMLIPDTSSVSDTSSVHHASSIPDTSLVPDTSSVLPWILNRLDTMA